MFSVDPTPTFEAPVPLSRPELEQPIEIHVTFNHKGRDDLADYLARAPGRADVDHLNEIIVSWRGVVDAEGKPVLYSYTALQGLLAKFTPAAGEIHRAYLRALTEAKRKN